MLVNKLGVDVLLLMLCRLQVRLTNINYVND